MLITEYRTYLPVLLLHNIDHAWEPDHRKQALQETTRVQMSLLELGHPVTVFPVYGMESLSKLRAYDPSRYIIFNWCEDIPGVPHSEAIVAEVLEDLKFTYTGSTPEVLHLCWDKYEIRQLLETSGLTVPRGRLYENPGIGDWNCFPAIVKPSREHCSYGVTTDAVVMTPGKLKERVVSIIDEFGQPALVEDFIDGREFHVTLWGNQNVEILPPAEMDFAAFDNVCDRLCTYDSKFKPGSPHYVNIGLRLPAPLDVAEYEELKRVSIKTYMATGCRDYARLDIRLRDGVFYILDVNPNADISEDASMACAAEAAGYSYGTMLSYIVNLAARRHPVFGKRDI